MILWVFEALFHPPYISIVILCGFTEKRNWCHSVSKKSTQKTFPPSEEKSFAPINNNGDVTFNDVIDGYYH